MSLFHYQRGRLVLAIVVMAGVGYLLALGTVFDSLGGIQVPDLTRPFSLSGSVSEPEGGLSLEQAAAKGQDTLAMVMDVTLSVGCQGWDPHGLIEDDPPDCLRAKQLREVQEFRKLDYDWEGFHKETQQEAINHLELCVLGYRVCPQRPLLITDYWYAFTAKTTTSGEGIWLEPVLETAVDLGFAWFPANSYKLAGNWNLTRIFKHSLHQYWTLDNNAFQCFNNPRCVRPEDFRHHPNESLRWDLDKIPEHDFGKMPAWRIFAPTFWGTRPLAVGYPGVNSVIDWGQGKTDNLQEWALHLLGQKWQITPYKYPGHTWIPLTVEQSCLSAPRVAWGNRKNQILILAKQSSYFSFNGVDKIWPTVIAEMKKDGYELITVAKEEEGNPIPEGIVKLGGQSKHEYEMLLASSKALLGIGLPQISPSPYNALCAGVPVVMPFWKKAPPGRGWHEFAMGYSQHGPINAVGAPYSYPYNISDVEMVVKQLRRAVSTPIDSYLPPENRLANVRKMTQKFLFHDWEAEYELVKREHGGNIPEYDPAMLGRCIIRGRCPDPRVDQETEGQ